MKIYLLIISSIDGILLDPLTLTTFIPSEFKYVTWSNIREIRGIIIMEMPYFKIVFICTCFNTCWNLECEGFSITSWHTHEDILPAQYQVYNRLLLRLELIFTKCLLKCFYNLRIPRKFCCCPPIYIWQLKKFSFLIPYYH